MSTQVETERITLSKIAEICGVSRRVVSHVVSGKSSTSIRYSDDTRDRVLKVIEENGYRPNRTVAGFFKKRHGIVGILGHTPYNIPQDTVATMMVATHTHDRMLCIEYIEDGKTPRMVGEDCVDGIIVFENIDTALLADMQRFRVPVAQVNTNDRKGSGCITYDEETAARQAAELFAARGCRRPAIAVQENPTDSQHYSIRVRTEAFTHHARALGMAEPVIGTAKGVYDDDYTAQPTIDFLQANPQVDCILAHLDVLTPAIYDAAAALGRKVPDDLAVIAYNDSQVALTVRPGLTTFSIDVKKLGTLAVDQLEKLMAGKKTTPITLPFTLTRRQSA